MIEWINVKNDQSWFDKWDEFICNDPRGNYLQYSDWIKGYKSYGFTYELILATENGSIVAGAFVVKAKLVLWKFYVVNCGPLVKQGYENLVEPCLQKIMDLSKSEKATYLHVNMPVFREPNDLVQGLQPDEISKDSLFYTGKEGVHFKYITSINGFRWTDFKKFNDPEDYVATLSANKRRNIRHPFKKGVVHEKAVTEDKIKIAYDLFKMNSEENGYTIRSWPDFKSTLITLADKGYAEFLLAEKDGDYKGAFFGIISGYRYSYIMGAAKREKPDLMVGYLLHREVIQQSFDRGYHGYDLSLGGAPGVIAFKNAFLPTEIYFKPIRHWVFSKPKFMLYKLISPIVLKNKVFFAKLLSKFK